MPAKKKPTTWSSESLTPEVVPLPEQEEFRQHLRRLAVSAVQVLLEQVMREELEQCIGASWGECTPMRRGYRNGSYTRDLVTTTGRIENLKVPRDREGVFQTEAFERYQCYEPEVTEALTQMFVSGISTHDEAVRSLMEDEAHVLTFYDFPQVIHRYIRTTNAIESFFSNVRQRTDQIDTFTTEGSVHRNLKTVRSPGERTVFRFRCTDPYEQTGKGLSCFGQQATYPLLKQQRPSLKDVHSQVLQNVAVRIDLAFQAFFRRWKAGEKPGYPRFRGRDCYDSFTFPQSGFSITHDDHVALSKIGRIKMVYHRPVKGTIKNCTIHQSRTGKWSVCFSVECEPERLPENTGQVGIDVGLKTFATLSTGEEIANPRFFRTEQQALAKVQRAHSKLAKGTPERRKHRKVVARVHERIAFRRENFTHQASRTIINSFGFIAVEDVHVNRMMHNHCLAKSIADASWSAFFSQLHSKAEEAGRMYTAVNPAYTSQDCNRCHHRHYMPLGERTYHCPCCLLVIDRDLNAAQNILGLGLQSCVIPEAPGSSYLKFDDKVRSNDIEDMSSKR